MDGVQWGRSSFRARVTFELSLTASTADTHAAIAEVTEEQFECVDEQQTILLNASGEFFASSFRVSHASRGLCVSFRKYQCCALNKKDVMGRLSAQAWRPCRL